MEFFRGPRVYLKHMAESFREGGGRPTRRAEGTELPRREGRERPGTAGARLDEIRARIKREALDRIVDATDSQVEPRALVRSTFMRSIDNLLLAMSPDHQNWNEFEATLGSRESYDAFISDTVRLRLSFAEWPGKVLKITAKIRGIVRADLSVARKTVSALSNTEDLLRFVNQP